MLASFRSFKSSALWRPISVACVTIVFSYIFFEVLDLDGSNFPLRYPVERTAIVSEVETNIIRPHLTRLAQPWTGVSHFLPTSQVTWIQLALAETPATTRFNLLQRHGYRTALPRSSIPNDLPFAA